MSNKTVAVIGAGLSGLVAAKNAIQAGLIPTVFEKAPDVGGMWNPECHHSWKSLKTNLSKYTTCFSDFPWEYGTSTFPTQAEMCRYLQAYSKQFISAHYFLFNTSVTNIKQDDQNTKTNQAWIVDWTNADGKVSKSFDFVIIATGFFSSPHTPKIHLDTFEGTAIHSGQYRSPEDFKEKRVVVVGASFSAAEIAAEVSVHAKSVVNIILKPFWTIPRYLPLEPLNAATPFFPVDLIFYSRVGRDSREALTEVVSKTSQDHQASNLYFSRMCGRQAPEIVFPDASTPQFVAISDDYFSGTRSGRIRTQQGRVQSLENSSVILEDGKKIENIDSVIFCTGFRPSFPFLDSTILDKISFDPNDSFCPVLLHKTTFCPSLPGLAFVGVYRGPYFLIVELQAMWVAKIFSGALEVVPDSVQEEGILVEKMIRHQSPRPQFPHPDYIGFAYFFAEQLGIVPSQEWAKAHQIITPFDFCPDRKLAQISLSYLDEDYRSFKSGKMVPGAIFRSLEGTWTFEQNVTASKGYGTFKGSATFTLVPSVSPDQLSMSGIMKLVNDDQTLNLETSFVWEYNQPQDQLLISLEDDGASVFSTLRFLPVSSDEQIPVELQELAGWKAVTEHSFKINSYKSYYLFQFNGINLKRMDIVCNMIGPQNTYSSVATFFPKS